jgi:alkanesulfonate monooxygenase SsuD/methylene tetrahydromethanopterin reductase-like flavin-dependent oxidoreductase (luciferase family)
LAAIERTALDRVSVGDHVMFRGGQGFDGVVHATALASITSRVQVQLSVYLLGLRHPVPVARQLSDLANLAPGRVRVGVGVGGDDRHEWEVCGLDPTKRGQRTEDSLSALRALLSGGVVNHHSKSFDFDDALIDAPPDPPVPILVGGRSEAALARTARLGDGWLGLFLTPERYQEAIATVDRLATLEGRTVLDWQHSMYVWCSFDSSPDRLASTMEGLYNVPFAKFERYAPHGSPERIADFVEGYLEAGCRSIDLAPVAGESEEAVVGAAEVKRILAERYGASPIGAR